MTPVDLIRSGLRRPSTILTAVIIIILCSAGLCVRAQGPPTLKLTRTIPLPGVKGRFDHLAMDAKGHRLFVAALGNNTLEVVDIAAGKRLASIPGLHKPQGVLYLAEKNQIAVASGGDGRLTLFDGTSYALLNSVGSLDDADNLRYDAETKLIYVGYADGALAMIDSAPWKQTGAIKLAAHPESFQLEQHGSRIFINLPDAKQIAVVDRRKQSVVATWPITKFQANFPMALDELHHRLFVGCRKPARLIVFDTTSGKPVTDLAISGDTDDLFYDATLKRIYVSCGEGYLDIIEQRDADTYGAGDRLETRPGARTSFFSADLNQFYLAVPARANEAAEIRVFQSQK